MCVCARALAYTRSQPTTPAKDAVLFEDALASVARAIVGAIYQIHVRSSLFAAVRS